MDATGSAHAGRAELISERQQTRSADCVRGLGRPEQRLRRRKSPKERMITKQESGYLSTYKPVCRRSSGRGLGRDTGGPGPGTGAAAQLCGPDSGMQPTPQPQVQLPPMPAATPITPNGTVVEDVIARVNDQIITRTEYERAEQQLMQEAHQENVPQAEAEPEAARPAARHDRPAVAAFEGQGAGDYGRCRDDAPAG